MALYQREMIGRTLHRLSCDLYSKQTHFILELVQNCDDNKCAGFLHEDSVVQGGGGVSITPSRTGDLGCMWVV